MAGGLGEGGTGSCCLVSTDLKLFKMKRVLEVGCTTVGLSITLLNGILKTGWDGKFCSYHK